MLADVERAKYERVWSNREYARQADGEPLVDMAFDLMGCAQGDSLIDWGCGCGRPAAKFADKGLLVLGVDIAENCLDVEVRGKIFFAQRCLWKPDPILAPGKFSFCTDVLEHIPLLYLGFVMQNILTHTRKAAFFQICVAPDSYGRTMSPPEILHLTVQPKDWWESLLLEYWPKVERVEGIGGKSRVCFLCDRA